MFLRGAGLGGGQVVSPITKRAECWRDGEKLGERIKRSPEISARFSLRIFRCAGDPAAPANSFRIETLMEIECHFSECRYNRVQRLCVGLCHATR